VQEALTNVLRHAPGAEAAVRVGIAPAGVRIHVTDTGQSRPGGTTAQTTSRASADGTAGHGIVGMRERAAIFKGTLEADPLPGGGFRVAATLPVPVTGSGRAT
jgi:signal transduction histidine kinase